MFIHTSCGSFILLGVIISIHYWQTLGWYVRDAVLVNFLISTFSFYAMFCLGLRDLPRNLVLHGFSQPICVPYDIVATAHNRSRHDTAGDFAGYDITIDEAVKIHIPYTKEQDWCCVLGGKMNVLLWL